MVLQIFQVKITHEVKTNLNNDDLKKIIYFMKEHKFNDNYQPHNITVLSQFNKYHKHTETNIKTLDIHN